MMWPILSRYRNEEPDQFALQRHQIRGNIVEDESNSTNAEMQAAGGIAFDFQVIDDEKVLGLFDPNNPLFHPLLLPLLPMVSRMMFLTNCTELEAGTYKNAVSLQIALLKKKAVCIEDYMLLNSLKCYLYMRINDSVQGFKLIKLTERTKNINIKDIQPEKKHGIFG